MRRLDAILDPAERPLDSSFHGRMADDLKWAVARIRRLESALATSLHRRHVRLRVGDSTGACDTLAGKGACNCGADERGAAVDAALKEDG